MQLAATDEFKVEWADPSDAALSWGRDPMHTPLPVVPLAQTPGDAIESGVFGARTVWVNGHPFSSNSQIPEPAPEIAERGVVSVWEDDYLPRVRAYCQQVVSTDWDAMPMAKLPAAMDEVVAGSIEAFRLTMVVVRSFMGPTIQLAMWAERELGADASTLIGTVLQGFDNHTSSAGKGLGELAEMAARTPELAAAIRAGNSDLSSVDGGPDFLAAFDRYLEDFGWRLESWSFLDTPTWYEDRSVPLQLIRQYLESPSTNPAEAIARAATQREAALMEVESRLDPEKREIFRKLLDAASPHVSISESRAHWQLTIKGVLRAPIMALGRKLVAAGVISTPPDIFYLEWDEAMAAARQPDGSLQGLVDRRRADYARWRTLSSVPAFIGAPPDDSAAPPEMKLVRKYFSGVGAPAPIEERVLSGFAASRGTHTGRARVIRSLAESDRLEPGDVLVCITTAAPWTPLFAIAGAVVTDTGGVISHSAICAREFAIPCVVGTQAATSQIPDGALVSVDGDAGTVRILE